LLLVLLDSQTHSKFEIDISHSYFDISSVLIFFVLSFSAYNVRNNAYKNAAFDILFDHEAS